MYDQNNPEILEKYSSAVTLSDMEIFVFPELLMSLVLANCMSPIPWRWRGDPWFEKFDNLSPTRKMHRLRQFVVDRFTFNLDLDTWGLTTKQRELSRFSSFINEEVLSQSNALFGYEGDKYYFDIDIRRHFGLDKYTSDMIPYWKTETIEAMEAFKFKKDYSTGAGECVSLSTLYAAALFVVAQVPLDRIFLMATPLHSQNFVDLGEGFLTNNRRVVTKTMWFNGSELSAKAQRALRHERVTLVANNTGYVHILYPQSTINPSHYQEFSKGLRSFLRMDIDFEVLVNFLRDRRMLQRCFQFTHSCCGKPRFIEAEKVFHYEHSSKSRAGDRTRKNLMHEIDEDEFYPQPIEGRIILDEIEKYFTSKPIPVDSPEALDGLRQHLCHTCFNVEEVIRDLIDFCRIEPRLPEIEKKQHVEAPVIDLAGVSSAEAVKERLIQLRKTSSIADLAFTAFRDMTLAPWKPFIKAALERNPVSVLGSKNQTLEQIATMLMHMPNESIYEGTRMAQPDEVWNFSRGDGLEKALCLMNIAKARTSDEKVNLDGDQGSIVVKVGKEEFRFLSEKKVPLPSESDFELTESSYASLCG